jgi:NAD(P)-dependent dehydrogenase (short-subunit alcohol dehydrogenase family)
MSKVLIVTGASRGIGAAIALRASREGYAVAVNYRHDEIAAATVVDRIRSDGGTTENHEQTVELQSYTVEGTDHGTVKPESFLRGLKWVWQGRQ